MESRPSASAIAQRSLLGAVAALIVARPLVAGPGAGLSPFSTDPGDLVLTLLWLVTALVWAGWFVWARPSVPRFGVAELALAVFGVLTLASVARAAYARPAWVGMSHTVAALVAFGVVRLLAETPAQSYALLHALLASTAGLAIRTLASAFATPTDAPVDPTVAQIFAFEPPAADVRPTDPHNAAAYLLLFLPVLAAIALVVHRRLRTTFWAWLPGGLLVLGLATLVVAVLTPSDQPTGSVSASQALVNANAALGVGPGNFNRFIVAFAAPLPAPVVMSPPTAFYAVYAASGVFAVVALVFAAWSVLVRLAAAARRPTEAESDRPTPWETYAGGFVGLVLGFALRPSGEPILTACAWAIGGSFVWFVVFALFDALPRSTPWTTGALGVGLAAVLLYLTFASGGSTALALPLAVTAALALNLAQPPGTTWTPRFLVTTLWPMPVLSAAVVVYLILVFVPVVWSNQEIQEARRFYPSWRVRNEPPAPGPSIDAEARLTAVQETRKFLLNRIVPRLEHAVKDGSNAAAWSELAWCYGENARLLAEIETLVDRDERPKLHQKQMESAERAIFVAAAKAQAFDPHGPTGYWQGCCVQLQVAGAADAPDEERREHYEAALQHLKRLAELTPQSAPVAYLTAETHFHVAERIRAQLKALPTPLNTPEAKKIDEALRKDFRGRAESAETAGRTAAEEARKLDALGGAGRPGLDDVRREQLDRWLRP